MHQSVWTGKDHAGGGEKCACILDKCEGDKCDLFDNKVKTS
jgi:hypothetical protein